MADIENILITAPDAKSAGVVTYLADTIGAPEAALRLLLTLLAGYPIAAIYRAIIVHQSSKPIHHIFFVLCGFFLCNFNYGFDTYHSLIAIWVTYLLVRLLHHAPHQLVAINFIFHMSYLLIGYYFTESNDYDIIWTMPHCVLVLRMIGFAFDVSDGRKAFEKLSKDQQETALPELPTLLELSAYAYFPSAFIVGPQFPYNRYKRFINGEFRQYNGSINAGIKRMLLGFAYLAVRQIGVMKLPDSYFLTDDFRKESFVCRLIYIGIFGKLGLYKYISCWLLTEGALMCLGFTYAGQSSDGTADWSGCSNVKLIVLETGCTMQNYVQSFNVNTNHWVAQYIYKRLKFLNNRTISYAAALVFLAIWHGFHTGYYVAFAMEYMIVTAEKQIEVVYKNAILPKYGHLINTSKYCKYLKYVLLKTYNITYMGWCMVPFVFLNNSRYMTVFSALNFFGIIFVSVWFIIYQLYQQNVFGKLLQQPHLQQQHQIEKKDK